MYRWIRNLVFSSPEQKAPNWEESASDSMHEAIRNESEEAIAKIVYSSSAGATLLALALKARKMQLVKLLISRGAQLSSPLHGTLVFELMGEAHESNDFSFLEIAILNGWDIHTPTNAWTLLQNAVKARNPKLIRFLVSHDANYDDIGKYFFYARQYAEYMKMIPVLIEAGLAVPEDLRDPEEWWMKPDPK